MAVVPQLFHRTGDPVVSYDDFDAVIPHFTALTAEGLLDDVDAALVALTSAGVPARSTGVVGFCLGGTLALITAAHRPVGAAVTFYGSGITNGRFGFGPLVDEVDAIGATWLGLYGDLDGGIPVDQVEQLRTAAAGAAHDTEIVRYPEAGHGFNCDQRDAFHAASAADAWQRTLDWFARYLTY
ncbi:hypothetical protein BH10ACT3_BH10ACT3_15670 [soil metagenome]